MGLKDLPIQRRCLKQRILLHAARSSAEAGCIRKQHQEAVMDEQPLNMNSPFVNALSYNFRKIHCQVCNYIFLEH